jgi:RNA polymerase sigma-70 factor (ECF subfamily)
MVSQVAVGVSDVALLRRVSGGDSKAFAELFDRVSPLALGVLVRLLGQRSSAEEVLQEVFLQVWTSAGSYRESLGSPCAWILGIARYRGIDRLRQRQARARREELACRREEDEVVTPDWAESVDRGSRVKRALNTLPAEQRACIELAFFEDLSHAEIAARLAAPLGTVKSRLQLGMRRLRLALGDFASQGALLV